MLQLAKKFTFIFFFLVGLPVLGIFLKGGDIFTYFEFPPKTRYVEHAHFSYEFFTGMLIFVLVVLFPFIYRAWNFRLKINRNNYIPADNIKFPWWGKAAVLSGIFFWILAWTRFQWFSFFQIHTFLPLWLSYIIFVNALTFKRCGRCMITENTGYFILLFPVSAVFWWFFEFLNRFVQNWYYVKVLNFSSVEYFLLATLSFSTVLPAVLGTRDFLETFPYFNNTYNSWKKIPVNNSKFYAVICLIISGLGLTGIGIRPNFLYPLLWVSPLLIIVSIQTLSEKKTIFTAPSQGNWSLIVTSSLAAVVCGFFWEMWNFYSMAKWVYSVPYIHRFLVFEMPIMGFFGYIPFGLECSAIDEMLN